MVGIAYQGGLIPLSLDAIEQAIRLNEVDVERNLQTFEWGRKYYHDAKSVEELLAPKVEKGSKFDRVAELTAYQNAAWAQAIFRFRLRRRRVARLRWKSRWLGTCTN